MPLPTNDPATANRAITLIGKGMILLCEFPFACRKADRADPFLRELLLRELRIPFGASRYVALSEIDDGDIVTMLAMRHRRESDCH